MLYMLIFVPMSKLAKKHGGQVGPTFWAAVSWVVKAVVRSVLQEQSGFSSSASSLETSWKTQRVQPDGLNIGPHGNAEEHQGSGH